MKWINKAFNYVYIILCALLWDSFSFVTKNCDTAGARKHYPELSQRYFTGFEEIILSKSTYLYDSHMEDWKIDSPWKINQVSCKVCSAKRKSISTLLGQRYKLGSWAEAVYRKFAIKCMFNPPASIHMGAGAWERLCSSVVQCFSASQTSDSHWHLRHALVNISLLPLRLLP